MKKIFSILLFVIGMIVSPTIMAREFKILDTSDGLPDNTVKCIVQDSQGFMWLGTFNGLCRFDGANFITYKSKPFGEHFLAGNLVECLLSVNDGLWIGTDAGLNYYSIAEDQFYPSFYVSASGEERLINAFIKNIIVCNGKIWVLTVDNELLMQQENQKFIVYDCGMQLTWLAVANYIEGSFLAYTNQGLYRIDAEGGIATNLYSYSAEIGTLNYGVLYYSENQKTIYLGAGIGHVGKAFKVISDTVVQEQTSFSLSSIKVIRD